MAEKGIMFKILWVGKTKEENLKNLIDEYKKRILTMIPLKIIEIEEEKRSKREKDHLSLRKESEKIIEKLNRKEYLIVLSDRGKMMSSSEFSEFLYEITMRNKDICFVLGGPWGLDKQLEERANFLFSLSPMTFPHELARVLLLEQIYRALSIGMGSKYHK